MFCKIREQCFFLLRKFLNFCRTVLVFSRLNIKVYSYCRNPNQSHDRCLIVQTYSMRLLGSLCEYVTMYVQVHESLWIFRYHIRPSWLREGNTVKVTAHLIGTNSLTKLVFSMLGENNNYYCNNKMFIHMC